MSPVTYHEGEFPPNNLDWERLIPLIGPANAAVARYEGVLHGIPNAHVLLAPLTSQEAVLSSRIEGTRATLEEVLEFEAAESETSEEKKQDILEIINYRQAMRNAVSMLGKLPLSQRLMRQTHKTLMKGVRGKDKAPGEFRKIQNWIGPPGATIEEARFIPPSPEKVPALISDWEKYLHSDVSDTLIQLAILHAEFEAIHPFTDGNGRIGRLIVPLYLLDKKLLSSPDFYISAYLEANREEYYHRLLEVSKSGEWTGWCRFFLQAIISQAQENEDKAKAILALYEEKKSWITDLTRSQYAIRALDWLFSRPLFKTSDFINDVDIPEPTAKRILKEVRDKGLLRVIQPARGRRAAVLAFSELINITEGKRVL